MLLDTEIALAAAEGCRERRLATANAIVCASARAMGATLVTRDGHSDGLPGVALIGKVEG